MAFNENLFVDIRSELLDRRLLFFHLLTFRSPSGRLDFFSIGFSTFLCERWQFFSCLRRRIQPNRQIGYIPKLAKWISLELRDPCSVPCVYCKCHYISITNKIDGQARLNKSRQRPADSIVDGEES